jgi:tRNA(Ile)-lysidine synthase
MSISLDLPMADCEPLALDQISDVLRNFVEPGEAVAVAVSGGPDSMALAFCLHRYGAKVQGLIVEHGLRPESPYEAQHVASCLRARGIEAEVLAWQHGPIESRIHVQARMARYALLREKCRALGLSKLFLAHHADDQAETVLLRLSKGSGIDGLGGMAPRYEQEGVWHLRPFLGVRKAALVATCDANNVPFVIDPSNAKESYARGRLRKVTEALAEEGLTTERLVDLADRAREAREALDFYTYRALRVVSQWVEGGGLLLDLPKLEAVPLALRYRILAACLQALHPSDYPPERQKLTAVLNWLLGEGHSRGLTLAGCYIHRNEGRRTALFVRELAAIPPVTPIISGQEVIWDHRWRVRLSQALPSDVEGGAAFFLAPLGMRSWVTLERVAPSLRRQIPSGLIRATLPALWHGGADAPVLWAVPSFSEQNQDIIIAESLPPFWLKLPLEPL